MDSQSPWPWVLGILGTIFVIWLLIFGIDLVSSRATPQAGEIGIVRTGPDAAWVGSWFNGHSIRNVVPPGSGSSFIGLGSKAHWYPSDSVQRNYTITNDPSRGDRPGVDVVEVPTSDGVRVGLEGTFYFTTAFNGAHEGAQLTKDFDNRFGVRTFPVVGSQGKELHPWEGIDGWSAFLDTVIRPIIDNDLRRSLATVSCPELVSSCVLVHNVGSAKVANGGANNVRIQQIQDAINASLQTDIKNTLGQDYFSNVRFLLAKVVLPPSVQAEIDNAQAQYAAVASSAAKVQQAQQDASANRLRQRGYQDCPACAAIDELKSIPPSVTTFAPGTGFAITPK